MNVRLLPTGGGERDVRGRAQAETDPRLALLVALGGTSYAAGYRITPVKQIAPKVRKAPWNTTAVFSVLAAGDHAVELWSDVDGGGNNCTENASGFKRSALVLEMA